MNRFILEKALAGEDVLTFNAYTAPELHKTLYSGSYSEFVAAYTEYENNPNTVKRYRSARELLVREETEANETATNFVMFADLVNYHTPHKDPIHTSNLCVAPETVVLTKQGYIAIQEIEDQYIEVWNGQEWSTVLVRETSPSEQLIQVNVEDSSTGEVTNLSCTPYHNFYLAGSEDPVKAADLSIGDILEEYASPDGLVYKFIVTDVIDTGRVDRVLCFNEPKRHRGVFNGILTGQCTEVLQPTASYTSLFDLDREDDDVEGEVSMCSLSAKNVAEDDTDEEYEESMYAALLMIDQCIHMSSYPFKHIGYTAKKRLNAGIVIIGLANALAKKGLKGKAEIHRIAERHMYMAIRASLRLGKQLGNAPWMHKTKWPEGWMPIDTYARFMDTVVPPKYHYDWETLRQEVIANGGIRNSSLVNHPPTETSSKASRGLGNSIYPVKSTVMNKANASSILEWAVEDGDILEYETAYEIPMVDWLDCAGMIQKFSDQASSLDLYEDRSNPSRTIHTSYLLQRLAWQYQRGIKTRYYINTKMPEEYVPDEIVQDEQRGCTGGGCTI